jgi:hypothetical protein
MRIPAAGAILLLPGALAGRNDPSLPERSGPEGPRGALMQDLEELLAQMADARKIYGKEPVAPYHGGNRGSHTYEAISADDTQPPA